MDPVNLIFSSMSVTPACNSTDFNRVAPDLYQGEWRIRLYYDFFFFFKIRKNVILLTQSYSFDLFYFHSGLFRGTCLLKIHIKLLLSLVFCVKSAITQILLISVLESILALLALKK